MLNSKFYTVMIVLTLLITAAALALQFLEMQQYGLIDQLTGK